MSKKIPAGIMHEPKAMVWAEATPLSEHKAREKKGVEIVNGTKTRACLKKCVNDH